MFTRFLCHYCQQQWALPRSAYCSNCTKILDAERYDATYQRCPDCFLPLLHADAQHSCEPSTARYLLFPSYCESAYYLRRQETMQKVPLRVCRCVAQLLLEPLVTLRCVPFALATCRFSQQLVAELNKDEVIHELSTELPVGEIPGECPCSIGQVPRLALIIGIYKEREVLTYQQTFVKHNLRGPYVLMALSE